MVTPQPHQSLSHPNTWERTSTCSSAYKTLTQMLLARYMYMYTVCMYTPVDPSTDDALVPAGSVCISEVSSFHGLCCTFIHECGTTDVSLVRQGGCLCWGGSTVHNSSTVWMLKLFAQLCVYTAYSCHTVCYVLAGHCLSWSKCMYIVYCFGGYLYMYSIYQLCWIYSLSPPPPLLISLSLSLSLSSLSLWTKWSVAPVVAVTVMKSFFFVTRVMLASTCFALTLPFTPSLPATGGAPPA